MAATLTVWKFPSATGARTAVEALKAAQNQQLITVHNAAIVSWQSGAKKPRTQQLNDQAAAGVLGSGFWDLLFGLIFFIPLLRAAVGAGDGAMTGSMTDIGIIDDDFITTVRDRITIGTSALFVLTSDTTLDRVHQEFVGQTVGLISTNLSPEEENNLRGVFTQ